MNKFAKAVLLALVVVTAVVAGTTVQAKSGAHRSKVAKVHRQYSSTHHAKSRTARLSTITGS